MFAPPRHSTRRSSRYRGRTASPITDLPLRYSGVTRMRAPREASYPWMDAAMRAWRNGRRYGLKHRWGDPCGFESRRPHCRSITRVGASPVESTHGFARPYRRSDKRGCRRSQHSASETRCGASIRHHHAEASLAAPSSAHTSVGRCHSWMHASTLSSVRQPVPR
jgi:hypothetical protein